jgi:UDP-N-acetylmuramoyl-tripeptide--D-alanyl-D-alanine ligase
MSLQHTLERFLGRCVKRAFIRTHPLVIGVAGSVGKSSTKTMIGMVLGAHEPGSRVIVSPKNFNNELGVPISVLGGDMPGRSIARWAGLLWRGLLTSWGLKALRGDIFVLELAPDKPGDLGYLIDMVRPNIGVLTAIGAEHTEFFGSIEAVAREEAHIVQCLSTEGVAICNADDPLVQPITAGLTVSHVTFGTLESASVRVMGANLSLDAEQPDRSGLDVCISIIGKLRKIRLHGVVGRSQTYAVAAACAVGVALDQDADAMARRIEEEFIGVPGRTRLIEGIKRTWLIDDSYNSSPLAVASAIRDLANFPIAPGARRIAALGDMRELGSLAQGAHEEEGRLVAEAGIDMLVVCGTLAHVVADAAKQAGMSAENIFVLPDSSAVGLFIQERLREGDVVLIKGSQNTVRMERVTKELMAHPERASELLVRQSKHWLETK